MIPIVIGTVAIGTGAVAFILNAPILVNFENAFILYNNQVGITLAY
jgi:hypothetical protein